MEKVNESVKKERESVYAKRVKYNDYSASEKAQIGKYAAENGPTRAVQHFSKTLSMKIPETTSRRLKAEYLATLKVEKKEARGSEVPQPVTVLLKMTAGRPLLLGKDLDTSVQNYINSLRKVGGVVNTAIVLAAANGIVAAKNPGLLTSHGAWSH